MGLLSDQNLQPLLTGSLLVVGSPPPKLRGAAVELSIGDIFLPGTKGDDPGSPRLPLNALRLLQGETAVVRTAEELRLDQDHAGLAFPAANVSLRGLLMTNPGYIDPGYEGPLHVTVINMGKGPYVLQRGASLMRCVLFKVDLTAKIKYPKLPSPITDDLLAALSKDFVDVAERAKNQAREEIEAAELRIKWRQTWIPVLVAVVGVAGTAITSWHANEARLAKLEAATSSALQMHEKISRIEGLLPVEHRVETLEEKTVPALSDRVQRLEDKLKRK